MILTRTMWCERCNKANRPYRDLVFIVCGSNGFHIRKVEKYIPPAHRGFTPHLVSLYKALDEEELAISRVCCMVGCGVTLQDDPSDRNKQIFTYRRVSYDQMSVKDWNALVQAKDLGYFI